METSESLHPAANAGFLLGHKGQDECIRVPFVALSLVLGLAVTLILTSLLAAFRARRETRMDALPFVWASIVLVYQFDFWWELYGLSALPTRSVLTFGLLLLLALLLFLAGGLVLPTGDAEYPADLGDYFRRDGRWGVVTLAAYNLVGSVTNVVLFGFAALSPVNILNATGIGLIAVVVSSSRRRVQWVVTLPIRGGACYYAGAIRTAGVLGRTAFQQDLLPTG